MQSIHKSEFDFELTEDQIAKFPLEHRQDSKLLVYKKGNIQHSKFINLTEHLDAGSLLIKNNAKVIPARLYFKRVSGAAIEVLLLDPVLPASYEAAFCATSSNRWKCIIGNSKKWKDNEQIFLSENSDLLSAKLIDRGERIIELSWANGMSFDALLDEIGELPLPPYLNRDTQESDYTTYQTVFAKNAGSVAAPTAGLHFTEDVFKELEQKSIAAADVTLHVGAGTFLPVKTDNVLDHDMHREYFEITRASLLSIINAKSRIAVGTTTLRVLESLYWIGVRLKSGNSDIMVNKLEPYKTESTISYEEALQEIYNYIEVKDITKLFGATEIMILPQYKLKSIDALITNFHLPESTLLMLVNSVVGGKWREIYKEALDKNYRFLSYGDSSLLQVNV